MWRFFIESICFKTAVLVISVGDIGASFGKYQVLGRIWVVLRLISTYITHTQDVDTKQYNMDILTQQFKIMPGHDRTRDANILNID